MAKIIVHKIDPTAKGSFRDRQRLQNALVEQQEAAVLKDIARFVKAENELNALAVKHMTTDDNTPIEEAIDQLSEDEFDALVSEFIKRKPTIPPENGGDSSKH